MVSAATTPRQRGPEAEPKADTAVGAVDWAAAAAAALRSAEVTAAVSPGGRRRSVSPSPASPPKKDVTAPPATNKACPTTTRVFPATNNLSPTTNKAFPTTKQASAPVYPTVALPVDAPVQQQQQPAVQQPLPAVKVVHAAVQADPLPQPPVEQPLPTKQQPRPTTSPTSINPKTRPSPPTAPPAADSNTNTPRIGAHVPSWLAVPPPPAPSAEPSAFSPLANGAPKVHRRLATGPLVSPEQLAHWEAAEQQQLAAVLLEEEAALQELGLSPVPTMPDREDVLRASWHHPVGDKPNRGVLGLSMDGGWDRRTGSPVALMPPVRNMWGLR